VEVLSTWDGRWYANIASSGYSVEDKNIRRFAFFPLLPAIARILGGPSHAVLAGIFSASAVCWDLLYSSISWRR
jgi:hypothetical protein